MTNCSKCGHVNDDSSKFCNMCGQAFENAPPTEMTSPSEEISSSVRCHQCGHLNPAGNLYCSMCRGSLSTEAPRSEPKVPPVAPPTIPPAQNPVLFAPPQPISAPSHKIPKWTIFALVGAVLFFVALGIFGAWNSQMHSGVFVDGKELTRHEARAGIDEMNEISDQMKSDKASLPNLNTSSPLSAKFLSIMDAIHNAQVKLNSDVGDANADKIISIQLGSAAGRRKSRQDHEKVQKALFAYFDAVHGQLSEIDGLIGNLFGPKQGHIPCNLAARIETVQGKCRSLIQARTEILDFMDQSKPTVMDGHFMFMTDEQIARFKRLVERHDASVEAFQQASTEYEKLVEADSKTVRQQIDQMTKGLD